MSPVRQFEPAQSGISDLAGHGAENEQLHHFTGRKDALQRQGPCKATLWKQVHRHWKQQLADQA